MFSYNYLYAHVCFYLSINLAYIAMCASIFARISISDCMYIYMYVYICMSVCMYICMYVYMYVYN